MEKVYVSFMYDKIDYTETLESFLLEMICLPQIGDRIQSNKISAGHVVVRRDYIYSNGKIDTVNVILERVA